MGWRRGLTPTARSEQSCEKNKTQPIERGSRRLNHAFLLHIVAIVGRTAARVNANSYPVFHAENG